MSIAVLTTVLPRGKRLGGDIGSQVFIDALRGAEAGVHVYGYDRPAGNAPAVPWETCVEQRPIETGTTSRARTAAWMLGAVAAGRPYSVQKYVSRRYRSLARGLAARGVDLVVVDHAQAGWLLPHVGDVPFVYVAHNVESEVYRSQAAATGGWRYRREARLIEALERDLAVRAEAVWTVTRRDADWFTAAVPQTPAAPFAQPPSVIPPLAPASSPRFDVGLLGTWAWEANAVGLQWFADEVLPRMGRTLDVRVAGLGGEEALGGRAGLSAVGRVPDAVAFLRDAAVVVLPTQAGGGVQIKAIDAISVGAPILATSMATRGIDDLPAHVRTADDPAAFAAELAALLDGGRTGREPVDAHAWATERARRFTERVATELARVRAGLA